MREKLRVWKELGERVGEAEVLEELGEGIGGAEQQLSFSFVFAFCFGAVFGLAKNLTLPLT